MSRHDPASRASGFAAEFQTVPLPKLVDRDGEIYARMLKSFLALTEVVGEIKRAREDLATDALIGISMREQSTT